MSQQLKECENQALMLPPKERAILAEHLIESLDVLNDKDNEQLWLEEAEKRYQRYKKGEIPARPAKKAINNARARIK